MQFVIARANLKLIVDPSAHFKNESLLLVVDLQHVLFYNWIDIDMIHHKLTAISLS